MLFDRNEIHIQALVVFSDGKCSICQSSSPQNYFKKYIFKIYTYKLFSKRQNAQLQGRKSRNHELLSFVLGHSGTQTYYSTQVTRFQFQQFYFQPEPGDTTVAYRRCPKKSK